MTCRKLLTQSFIGSLFKKKQLLSANRVNVKNNDNHWNHAHFGYMNKRNIMSASALLIDNNKNTSTPAQTSHKVQVDWVPSSNLQFEGLEPSSSQNQEKKESKAVEYEKKVLMSATSSESGLSPMKMLLHALGACASVDVLSILRKQKQKVEAVKIEIDATRAQEYPKPYEKIHMKFIVSGKDLSLAKVEQAVHLSTEKYCGVHATLKGKAEITHECVLA